MRNFSFFLSFLLIFVVACGPAVSQSPPAPIGPQSCVVDSDCVCGGIDKATDDCFVGNKDYAKDNVDFGRDCPDFCAGIAGHLETKCVKNTCQNVVREGGLGAPVACTMDAKVCPDGSSVGRQGPSCEFAPCPGEQVGCTKELKICPDGTGVGRTGPNCEFEPCPTADLSNAHWLCEDGSWKEDASDCFVNKCLSKADCQMIGVKGICGPYKIAAPTSMHKPPVFYENRCGKEPCSVLMPACADPTRTVPFYTGVDCVEGACILREKESAKECDTAADCAPAPTCHPKTCVPLAQAKASSGMACTMNCEPGTLDCGQGSCGCVNNKCVARLNENQI